MRRLLGLALLALTPAHAAQVNISDLQYQPHAERVLAQLDAKLAYPVGEQSFALIFDCKSGKTTVYEVERLMGVNAIGNPDFPATQDPAKTRALYASGAAVAKPGALTLKGDDQGTVAFRCEQGIVTLDFSKAKLIAEPALHYQDFPDNDPPAVITRVPILSEADKDQPYGSFDVVAGISADLTPRGAVIDDVLIGGTDLPLGTGGEVFVSDGKALYPAYYAGQSQDNPVFKNLKVGNTVEVYLTPDGKTWRKTTFDLKRRTVRTVPSAKPTLPIKP